MPGPPRQLAPRNDNLVWVTGVVDDSDPINADGTPKYIGSATVTWEIRTASQAEGGGSLIASGTATVVGSGVWLCTLSHTLAIGAANDYYFHVVITTTGGMVGDLDMPFKALDRTGETLTT